MRASTLRALRLPWGHLKGAAAVAALGSLMGKGGLPALEELDLSDNYNLGGEGIAAFFEALSSAADVQGAQLPPAKVRLRIFDLEGIGFCDRGYDALATALERGALGPHLERLVLFRLREAGLAALTRVMSGKGRQHVGRLREIRNFYNYHLNFFVGAPMRSVRLPRRPAPTCPLPLLNKIQVYA